MIQRVKNAFGGQESDERVTALMPQVTSHHFHANQLQVTDKHLRRQETKTNDALQTWKNRAKRDLISQTLDILTVTAEYNTREERIMPSHTAEVLRWKTTTKHEKGAPPQWELPARVHFQAKATLLLRSKKTKHGCDARGGNVRMTTRLPQPTSHRYVVRTAWAGQAPSCRFTRTPPKQGKTPCITKIAT